MKGFCDKKFVTVCLEQGCTTQFPWRAKKKFLHARGPKLTHFFILNGVFMKETGWINKILGFAGLIWSFCGPLLARGPYVVHVWSRTLDLIICLPLNYTFLYYFWTILCNDAFYIAKQYWTRDEINTSYCVIVKL